MITRAVGDGLILIKQIDHAALAERIMSAWRRDGLPESPRRALVLLATGRHDDGWIDEDREPLLEAGGNQAGGEVLDYVHAPDEVRRRIWPRGVERLAAFPYAAALVAQHALHLFERYRSAPAWQAFFAEMERARAEQLAAAAPRTDAELQNDYFFVRMGDLLSLQFCDDWREPQQHGHYMSTWNGRQLTVTPDPFEGESIPLRVPGRQMTRSDLVAKPVIAAFDAAPIVTISGVAAGPATT